MGRSALKQELFSVCLPDSELEPIFVVVIQPIEIAPIQLIENDDHRAVLLESKPELIGKVAFDPRNLRAILASGMTIDSVGHTSTAAVNRAIFQSESSNRTLVTNFEDLSRSLYDIQKT